MIPDIKEVTDTDTKQEVKPPRKYKVIFYNDDYTPMDFVMEVLMLFFNKNPQEAEIITIQIHHKGKSIVAVYSKNIAQMKVKQVLEAAKANQFPLKCTMEAE